MGCNETVDERAGVRVNCTCEISVFYHTYKLNTYVFTFYIYIYLVVLYLDI